MNDDFFDATMHLECFIVIPGVEGEVEMPDSAWDEHVESHSTIGELKHKMNSKAARKRFTFPEQDEADLQLFYNQEITSKLDDDVELIDRRIKKHHVNGRCLIKLYAMPWTPQTHIDFLVEFRNTFFNGNNYEIEGMEIEQRWYELTAGWQNVQESFGGISGLKLQTDSWHLRSLIAHGSSVFRIEGELPSSVGSMDRLLTLDLAGNSITGHIPAEICNCISLQSLYLQQNELEGPIPANIGAMQGLTNLVLFENQLSGEIPASIGECKALKTIYLQHNCLSGVVPDELGDCPKVKLLYMDHNVFEGPWPVKMGGLKSLQHLSASYNHFSGEPPSSMTNCRRLRKLDFTNNSFDQSGIEQFHKIMMEQIGSELHMELDGLELMEKEHHVNLALALGK
jgi:hypothetical protein